MQEHPIPRQITTFEFKLIGELTLKQFGFIAFGAVGGVILFFAVPSFALLNWVAAAVPVGLALAFAFMPINERPMDIWVKNLYRRLTTATQFYYKKNNPPPKILLGLTLPPREVMIQHIQAQQKLNEYLQTKPKLEGANTGPAISETIEVRTKGIKSLMQGNTHGIQTSFAGAPGAVIPGSSAPVQAPLTTSQVTNAPVTPVPAPEVAAVQAVAPTSAFAGAFGAASDETKIAPPSPAPAVDMPQSPPVAAPVAVAPTAPTDQATIAAANTIPENAAPQSPTTRFSFRGGVFSPNGVPLSGILVYVKKGDESVRLFRTNEKGEFINNIPLPSDNYILELEDPQKKYAFDRMNVNGATTSYEIFAQKI